LALHAVHFGNLRTPDQENRNVRRNFNQLHGFSSENLHFPSSHGSFKKQAAAFGQNLKVSINRGDSLGFLLHP
jgi:hypothetical protein